VSEKSVSVIITVLNDKRVGRTIESILEQSLVPDEIFVADGGSDDGTWELILNLKEKYGDIINPQRLDGNIPTTRNKALPLMKGDVIVFIDADEIAPKDWLKSLINSIVLRFMTQMLLFRRKEFSPLPRRWRVVFLMREKPLRRRP
jgi:glycosyltransferase involved in cell wall biosynthesis